MDLFEIINSYKTEMEIKKNVDFLDDTFVSKIIHVYNTRGGDYYGMSLHYLEKRNIISSFTKEYLELKALLKKRNIELDFEKFYKKLNSFECHEEYYILEDLYNVIEYYILEDLYNVIRFLKKDLEDNKWITQDELYTKLYDKESPYQDIQFQIFRYHRIEILETDRPLCLYLIPEKYITNQVISDALARKDGFFLMAFGNKSKEYLENNYDILNEFLHISCKYKNMKSKPLHEMGLNICEIVDVCEQINCLLEYINPLPKSYYKLLYDNIDDVDNIKNIAGGDYRGQLRQLTLALCDIENLLDESDYVKEIKEMEAKERIISRANKLWK